VKSNRLQTETILHVVLKFSLYRREVSANIAVNICLYPTHTVRAIYKHQTTPTVPRGDSAHFSSFHVLHLSALIALSRDVLVALATDAVAGLFLRSTVHTMFISLTHWRVSPYSLLAPLQLSDGHQLN